MEQERSPEKALQAVQRGSGASAEASRADGPRRETSEWTAQYEPGSETVDITEKETATEHRSSTPEDRSARNIADDRFGDAEIQEDKILDDEVDGHKPPSETELQRSFEDAKKLSQEKLGDQARTYPAQTESGNYRGTIIGETDQHFVQQLNPLSTVAHPKYLFSERARHRAIRSRGLLEQSGRHQRVPTQSEDPRVGAMKQHGLYKTPKDPGHLGGYLWKPTVMGFLLLLVCNVVATQFVAYRFQYQRALGAPLLRTPGFAIYQPFAWAIWLLKYASHPDPRIRLGILSGPLIVVTGCVATMGIFAATNLRRTKKLSENTEDLHGSARWAKPEDVNETGLLTARHGVYIGGWYNDTQGRLHYLRDDGPAHVLAFAPTRSGKGVGLVIPTLLVWPESCVVYDIKGENWAKTAGFRQQAGQVCFKFSPVEVGNGSRFNPLAEVRIFTERDVADAQNVADMIIRTGEESPQERYWQDAAASIGTGMVLHVCYAAAQRGKNRMSCRLCPCLHPRPHEFQRGACRAGEFPSRSRVQAGLAYAGWPANRDAPGGGGESSGDARQGGQGFQRRALHCKDGVGPLQ